MLPQTFPGRVRSSFSGVLPWRRQAGLPLALVVAATLAGAPWRAVQAAEPAAPAAASPVVLGPEALDVEKPDRLKGLKRVALASVAVYVLTESSGGASAGAAGHGSIAVVNASLKVVGLEPARLQALADAAHDGVRAALQARGLEVMPQAEFEALPAYAPLKALADATPLSLDVSAGKGVVLAGRGLPVVHMAEQVWLSRMTGGVFGAKVDDPYVALGDTMSAGFRKVRLDPALEKLGQEAGVPLVMARLVLTAAQLKASGGAFSWGAKTEVRNSLLMPTWTNRLLVRTVSGDYGRVSLKAPLISETALGELVDVTSTGAKAMDVATTALTTAAALFGAGRAVSQSTQNVELRTTPDQFEAVAMPHLLGVAQALAGALTP
jgi:hypothetical protein